MKIIPGFTILSIAVLAALVSFTACSFHLPAKKSNSNVFSEKPAGSPEADSNRDSNSPKPATDASSAVHFNRELDSYVPRKRNYSFYFTYKSVHAWWDAVALGMEEAQRQFMDKGISITYEYMAPDTASAEDQKLRLLQAQKRGFDVIGVDVADEKIISPFLDEMVDSGTKVMTFSSSDASEGCKRIAYVGNTHNYEDGVDLTEALCKKLGYKGKVAILVGSFGAPCHEDRARGVRDTIAQYDQMEIVATEYDMDSVNKAHDLTINILRDCPALDGIICCNMSNPVGAARAVTEMNSGAVIVGMDHDAEALRYLNEGIIYCLGVQDCFSIGFDTLQVAVKIADGNLPGELFPEKTDEITTIIYQEDATLMQELLYGEI